MSRLNHQKLSPQLFQKLYEMTQSFSDSPVTQNMRDLVHVRASQLNGCAFCLDMHVKEAKIHGERELRLYHLPIWRESSLFSAKEKAILEWTELITLHPEKGISDETFNRIREHLSEKELSDLTYDICLINFWNRLNAAGKTAPGTLDAMMGLDKAGLK
jgi:AhpD family alkylhydroperoxidase